MHDAVLTVSPTLAEESWTLGNVPSIARHGSLWVVQVEAVGKVVLGSHGLRVLLVDVDAAGGSHGEGDVLER